MALENITAPFRIGEADHDEASFFTELVARTGCGLLLDVTNLLTNARNFGFDPWARLQSYPLEHVWSVHLAGGHVDATGWWVDSHSHPVEGASFELLDALSERAPLRTIIVERDERLPPLAELVAECQRAEALWLGAP